MASLQSLRVRVLGELGIEEEREVGFMEVRGFMGTGNGGKRSLAGRGKWESVRETRRKGNAHVLGF